MINVLHAIGNLVLVNISSKYSYLITVNNNKLYHSQYGIIILPGDFGLIESLIREISKTHSNDVCG